MRWIARRSRKSPPISAQEQKDDHTPKFDLRGSKFEAPSQVGDGDTMNIQKPPRTLTPADIAELDKVVPDPHLAIMQGTIDDYDRMYALVVAYLAKRGIHKFNPGWNAGGAPSEPGVKLVTLGGWPLIYIGPRE